MLTTEQIDDYNEYVEEEDQIKVESKAMIKYVAVSDEIDAYGQEVESLRDDMYEVYGRMDQYGFDGDFDPNARAKRRLREIDIIATSLHSKLRKIQTQLTKDDLESLDRIDSYNQSMAEIDAISAAERAVGA
jgi:hypothetical protein